MKKTTRKVLVYDLASELGVRPLELLMRIKELKLSVKTLFDELDSVSRAKILSSYGVSGSAATSEREFFVPTKPEASIVKPAKPKRKKISKMSASDKFKFDGLDFFFKALSVAVLFVGGAAGARIYNSKAGEVGINKSGIKGKWKG